MNIQAGSRFACALLVVVGSARAQSPPTSATIDAEPMNLTMPEHFQVVSTLEPIRRVSIIAPVDGLIRSIDAGIGTAVREGAQVAELDRGEADARLKIAEAELMEANARETAESALGVARQQAAETQLMEARARADAGGELGEGAKAQIVTANGRLIEATHARNAATETAKARVVAAQARLALAQLELDRRTLRAPFAGTIIDLPVASGQFVLKGTVVAELADLSTLRALVPVDRREATAGGELKVWVEDQEQTAKVKAIVPLPATDEYRPLRELASPLAAAWVQLPNPKGELEPGLRVRGPSLPVEAVATVPKRSVQSVASRPGDARVQVIRNEYVVNVRVKVLGAVGPERVQITGALRPSDALITSTSAPLLAGTLVRFGGGGAAAVEGTTPDPNRAGRPASLSTPGQTVPATTSSPAAPRSAPQPARATRPAAPAQSGGGQPF